MAGNFWCFGCQNWINVNGSFLEIVCVDEECKNCNYFCDESCLEIAYLKHNLQFDICYCCSSDVKKNKI